MRRKRKRSRTAEVEGVDAEEEELLSDAEVLAAIAEEARLFHTPSRESFASVPGNVNRKGKRVIGEKESTADVRWSTTIRSVSV